MSDLPPCYFSNGASIWTNQSWALSLPMMENFLSSINPKKQISTNACDKMFWKWGFVICLTYHPLYSISKKKRLVETSSWHDVCHGFCIGVCVYTSQKGRPRLGWPGPAQPSPLLRKRPKYIGFLEVGQSMQMPYQVLFLTMVPK